MRYPIVIHKDSNSDYGVIVPDLPGCFSAAASLEEALDLAREAIECHMEGMVLDGDSIPAIRPLKEHQSNPDFAGGIWAVVDVDLSHLDDHAERVNITLPRRVLSMIDRYAADHHESRSGFLARAALVAMQRSL
ncbi:MAG: type II toxin-antitoxin system HicB family antitoxin [Sulfuricellaceae bacterium]